jgi:hypothetical protein
MGVDITEDTGRATLPDDASLGSIAALAIELRETQARAKDLEDALIIEQDRIKRLAEQLIPDQMASLGLSEFRLNDGSCVTVKSFVSASIPKEKTMEAHAWLEREGHGDLIKSEVKASFGAGETEAAQSAAEKLRDVAGRVELKRAVHPQTLMAFAREMYEEGNSLPDSLFSIYIGRRASLK